MTTEAKAVLKNTCSLKSVTKLRLQIKALARLCLIKEYSDLMPRSLQHDRTSKLPVTSDVKSKVVLKVYFTAKCYKALHKDENRRLPLLKIGKLRGLNI